MAVFTLDEVAAIEARHPDIFSRSLRTRLTGWAIALGVVLYFVFAWWFFSIGTVFSNGRWDIAGAYLADWISYESRPNVDFEQGYLKVGFPRFDPEGNSPDPDWMKREEAMVETTVSSGPAATVTGGGVSSSAGSFLGTIGGAPAPAGSTSDGTADAAAETKTVREKQVVRTVVDMSGAGTVEIVPGRVTVTRGGETLVAEIETGKSVRPHGELPDWATQKNQGGKIVAWFGFPGRVEIDDDTVKIRHRFFGWENFFFDADSAFWGKSFGEVFALVNSDQRIDPARSNLSLAWNDILYNKEWQHLDVWTKLLQTIVMAFAGTVLASLVAFPLAFLAARNITRNRLVNQIAKRFFDFQRSVDMLIWALFFTRAFGPGPLSGIAAIFFTDTGTFGKLYSESLENIDDRQREGVRSVGAPPVAVQRFGVLPQVLPVFLSQSLYFWESNTRSATIIGAMGAGGIGLKLWEAMRTNSDWENVAYMVILILVVVFIFDNISNLLRQKLISPRGA